MAGRPAHGCHRQADIRSGLRCWLERPLSEAQLTKDRGWTGALLERLLPSRANSQCRPIGATRPLVDCFTKHPKPKPKPKLIQPQLAMPPNGSFRIWNCHTASILLAASPAARRSIDPPNRVLSASRLTNRAAGCGNSLFPVQL